MLESAKEVEFERRALKLFKLQSLKNPIYRRYIAELGVPENHVKSLHEIPFLPIEFFKHQTIKTGEWREEEIFLSSGTTGTARSRHAIRNVEKYHRNTLRGFNESFGDIGNYRILAMLPNYLENENSSLISMVNFLISNAGEGWFT